MTFSEMPWTRKAFACLAAFVALLALSSFRAPDIARADGLKPVEITYFYMNPCQSCDTKSELYKLVGELLGDEAEGVDIKYNIYNTFTAGNQKKLNEYLQRTHLSAKSMPILFVGDQCMMGEDEIRSKFKDAFLRAKAAETPAGGEKSVVYYFYVAPCDACEKVSEYLATIGDRQTISASGGTVTLPVVIRKFNVSDAGSLELARKYFKEYNVPDDEQEVPIAFIGDGYLSGEQAVRSHLLGDIHAGKGLKTRELDAQPAPGEDLMSLSGYELAGVFFTGLVNGLNPCSISILLFFLSMLIAKNIKVIKVGLSFIAGKYVSYVLLGTILYDIFHTVDESVLQSYQLVVKAVFAALAVGLAVFNVIDYFTIRKEKYDNVKLQLPLKIRQMNYGLIKRVSGIADMRALPVICFAIGAAISVGEFLCTGQVYLATIVYFMKRDVYSAQAFLYFLIYCFSVQLPLLLIVVVIHRGKEVFAVSELVRGKYRYIKLIYAAFFLLFAAALLIFI